MRIGIDVTFLLDQYSRRGIGTYGRELISRMLADKQQTYVLFGFGTLKEVLSELGVRKSPNIEFVSLGRPRGSNPLNPFYFKFFYQRKIRKAKLDVYFAPHFERGLPIGITKTVVMMHDVIPLVTNSYSQRGALANLLKGFFYRRNLRQAKKADLILTNSEFSKRELINKGGFAADKVQHIYLGINNAFRRRNITSDTREIRRVLIMYKITSPYFLYYGGFEENKNISMLLQSFKKVIQRHPDLKLVLAGKEFKVGWDSKPKPQTISALRIQDLIDELKLKHSVILTGEIDARHLPIVLANAVGFIHLSTYEGFGFSVVEALAAGVPVIAPRRSSYPEILGEAVEYVAHDDADKIAKAIQTLTQEDAHRTSLIEQGLRQSEQYQWDKTSRETLKRLMSLGSQVVPLKIGYIIPYFLPFHGGAENNCYALARQMTEMGHKVTVFTSYHNGADPSLAAEEIIDGIRVIRHRRLNRQYYLGLYPSLLWSVLRSDLDVLHVHGFGFLWHDFVLLCKKLLSRKTRIINTPHGPFMALGSYSFPKRVSKLMYTIVQRLFVNRLYSAIIEVNPNQQEWIKHYGISSNKIQFIPNGIPQAFLQDIPADELKSTIGFKRQFVISFIGRFEKYKGLEDLITAAGELIAAKKNILVLAIGHPGSYLEKIQEQIINLDLDKQVHLFLAADDSIREQALTLSDVYVLPSEWEAFGIGMLEAMAKGNAVISTRTEGGEFLIKDGENGFLFDYGDSQELKSLLSRLIDEKDLLGKMQKINKEKAAAYTWEKIAVDYYQFLKKLTR